MRRLNFGSANRPSRLFLSFLCAVSLGLGCTGDPSNPDGEGGGSSGDGGSSIWNIFDAGSGGGDQPDAASGVPTDGGIEADAGSEPPPTGPVSVEAVSPPTGALEGGYRARVDGDGFSPESRVFFGENEADQLIFITGRSLTCRVPPGTDPGPTTVRVEDPQGNGQLAGAFTYFSPVTLESIVPNVGTTSGGTEVTIYGAGFHQDMLVLFAGREAANLQVAEDGLSATLLTPNASEPGRVDVEAIDGFGNSSLDLGFTYEAVLTVNSVDPAFLYAADDNSVDVHGSGFDESTVVLLNNDVATVRNLINQSRLRIDVPASYLGFIDITAQNANAIALLEDALFVAVEPASALEITAAIPNRGDVLGGEEITLFGGGFADTTGVTVNGVDVLAFEIDGTDMVHVTTPAGQEGSATIELTTAQGSTSYTDFSYVTPFEVSSVSPNKGPATGGTNITITGRNFEQDADVYFNGIEATNVQWTNSTTITATTPAGSSGFAEISVLQNEETAVLSDGFFFETELHVLGVMPPRGGISGGTYVEISGSGFLNGNLEVRFGGLPGSEVTVVSDHVLHAFTPPSPGGVVDVEIQNATTLSTATDAFTYFDPAFLAGGTRGGEIDGAIYLTALDSLTGFPIPDLTVYLGTEGASEYFTTTNLMGQATLSGPDIVGPQTISVGGEGYEYASLVDVNAAEVTVYLQPLNLAPPSSGQPPPGPPPATIRGRVFGFAKEFFDPAALGPDEIALAIVTTTARDEFSGIPDPGGDNVVYVEGGEYFIANSRPGRLAIVALAGIFNLTTTEFRMRQMGVRRNLYPQYGTNLEDQDITLSIPLDVDVDVSLPDAPVEQFEGGPTITRVIPFLRFGGEGALAYTTAISTSRNHLIENMPDVPGEMLTFIAGAYTTSGGGLVTDQGTAAISDGGSTVIGTGTNWAETDLFGNLLVQGGIFVATLPDGTKWAAEVLTATGDTILLLKDRAPVTGLGLTYHIGNPSYPSSEVVQDGVGELTGGVTIQPVLGLPEPLAPVENGVLGPDRELRWKAAAGQQPTFNRIYVYDPINFSILWTFYIDGTRTKVPIPMIPPSIYELGLDGVPTDIQAGGYFWQHNAMYVPGFEYNNWNYIDIGTNARRSWTTDVHRFVYGGN
jgi:hypothetical protein